MPKFQPADRLLVASDQLGSLALQWWLNSKYSHCVPVLNAAGKTLEIRWPKPFYSHAGIYLDGRHRVLHLRPAVPLVLSQQVNFVTAAEEVRRHNYDIRSFGGFLTNRPEVENQRRFNCSEGLLHCDHAAGLLTGRDMALVSPQSYVEFAAAGVFEIVGRY